PVWWMNAALVVLAIGSIAGGFAISWISPAVMGSTAATTVEHSKHTLLGMDPHTLAVALSFIVSFGGIAIAWFFHLINRGAADAVCSKLAPVVKLLENKYFTDELYDLCIVVVLRVISNITTFIDRLIVEN